MSVMRRPSPMRPSEPPPYPGRSVVVNYNINDPLHWKNRLEKSLPSQVRPIQHVEDNTAISEPHPSVAPNEHQSAATAPLLMPPPASRPSPVAAGAILTLGELKRKQMYKRRCKLAASGVVNYGEDRDNAEVTQNMNSDEWDTDNAEISLEKRLHTLLLKENLTLDNFPAVDYRFAPTTSFDSPDPETVISDCRLENASPPQSTTVPSSSIRISPAPTKPPRAVRPDPKYDVYTVPVVAAKKPPQATARRVTPQVSSYSVPNGKFSHELYNERKDRTVPEFSGSQVLGSNENISTRRSRRSQLDHPQPPHPARSSSTSSYRSPTPNGPAQKSVLFTFDDSQLQSGSASSSDPMHRIRRQISPVTSHAINIIRPHRNYPVTTPPLPPVSPENSWSADDGESVPRIRKTCFWDEHASVAVDGIPDSTVAKRGHDTDIDSVNGEETRTGSSDEGFCGNSDSSSEEVVRKQVMMMCDMQRQLFKLLNGGNGNKKDLVPGLPQRDSGRGRMLHVNRHDSHSFFPRMSETETQARCEMLEDHIAILARNIEYLTDEIQNQQAAFRQLRESPTIPNQIRHDAHYPSHEYYHDDPPTPRRRMNSYSESPMRVPAHATGIVREKPVMSPVEKTETIFSNPERMTKLTKFFGSEPPMVRLFLKRLGYEKYARLFELEKIGANELPYMTEDRLRRLGIPMGPRTRILREAQAATKMPDDPYFYLV